MPRERTPSPRRHDRRSHAESSRDDHNRHRSHRADHTDDRDRRHRYDDVEERRSRYREGRASERDGSESKQGRSAHYERKRSYDSEEEDEERRRRKREKKEQEKAARKAAKRAAKEEDEASAQRALAAEALMYSAEDNPFNDADLNSRFKWRKKEDKEKKQGMSRAEAEARDAERRREAMEEIARLNQKRAEREKEQQEREEEEARMARLAESAAMSEWVAKEDDFHLQQSRKRAAIRVREGRAKPIDLLAINLKWADPKVLQDKDSRDRTDGNDDDDDDEAGLEIDLEEPYLIFQNLTLGEVEELHQDIQMYLTLEKNEQHLDFWKSMVIVCEDKLDELRVAQEGANPQQRALDPAIRLEMDGMLGKKTHEQLVGLQDQVRSKLRSGESIDVEYWEGLLKQIVVWRAKARLRDQHENVLANRIAYLRKRQRLEAERIQEELKAQMLDGEDDAAGRLETQQLASGTDAEEDQVAEAQAAAAEAELLRIQTEWDETMEPSVLDRNSLPYAERQVVVIDPDEDRKQLLEARRKVLGARFVPRVSGMRHAGGEGEDADTSMWKQEASKPMDVEEEAFNNAEELVGKSYQWEDKYRPRKPRYFNRVHTGYEWSRYNQTHYDSVENPPPKVVQGYKFNIFYPDLIDKNKAPTYRIRKDPNDPDTAIIVFMAGPPYEDIAFRVVNKPWNLAHRRGFRASFDRGIMQLYFSFQRNFYRK